MQGLPAAMLVLKCMPLVVFEMSDALNVCLQGLDYFMELL